MGRKKEPVKEVEQCFIHVMAGGQSLRGISCFYQMNLDVLRELNPGITNIDIPLLPGVKVRVQ